MIFLSDRVTQASGSIGGVTYSHNKGGMYCRSRKTPINSNTTRQQVTRSLVGKYAGMWTSVLVQAQRDLWDAFAATHTIKNALGQDIYINGIAWYIKCNTRLDDAGQTAVAVPPLGVVPDPLTTCVMTATSPSTLSLAFTPTPLGASVIIQLWMTIPGSTGQTPNKAQARLVGYSTISQTSPYAPTSPFGFGVGQQMNFFAAVLALDGMISVPLAFSAIGV